MFNMFNKKEEPESIKKEHVEVKDNYEFIKMDAEETALNEKPKEEMSIEEYKQMAEIKDEETKVLWDYYAVKEEEGLDRRDDAYGPGVHGKHGDRASHGLFRWTTSSK